MIRRPPRSTLDRSSAASDVYKRQVHEVVAVRLFALLGCAHRRRAVAEFDPPVPQAVAAANTAGRRDILPPVAPGDRLRESHQSLGHGSPPGGASCCCLLYTSDAADERSS